MSEDPHKEPPVTYPSQNPPPGAYENPPPQYGQQPQYSQPAPVAAAPAAQPVIINNTMQQQGGGVVVVNQVQPSDCLVCSILNCIFCNAIFGIIAIVFSCLARDSFERGALEEGKTRAKVAKAMNIVGPLITVVVIIIIIVYFVAIVGAAVAAVG